MADIEITVDGGTSKRLLTAGKYCDKNILVTATGGGAEPEPPDDGKTRLYITVPANSMPDRPPPRNEVPLYIQQTVDRGVTIDWGDGTEPETLPGTGNVNTTHTYEQAGDYVISLDPAEGCELGLGHGSTKYTVMGEEGNANAVYRRMIKYAVIGKKGVNSINSGAFTNCYALSSVTIPGSVESIGSYAFSSCYALSSVTIPGSVESIGSYAFSSCYALSSVAIPGNIRSFPKNVFAYCYALSSIVIPDSVESIGNYAFTNCYALSSIVIPGSVESIGNYAFSSCYGAKEYRLLPVLPPVLSNESALGNMPSDCILYVPVGSLEAYQTATNWSNYADHMQEEPA